MGLTGERFGELLSRFELMLRRLSGVLGVPETPGNEPYTWPGVTLTPPRNASNNRAFMWPAQATPPVRGTVVAPAPCMVPSSSSAAPPVVVRPAPMSPNQGGRWTVNPP